MFKTKRPKAKWVKCIGKLLGCIKHAISMSKQQSFPNLTSKVSDLTAIQHAFGQENLTSWLNASARIGSWQQAHLFRSKTSPVQVRFPMRRPPFWDSRRPSAVECSSHPSVLPAIKTIGCQQDKVLLQTPLPTPFHDAPIQSASKIIQQMVRLMRYRHSACFGQRSKCNSNAQGGNKWQQTQLFRPGMC